LAGSLRTVEHRDDHRRDDGDCSGDQAALPESNVYVDEAIHDDLPGQRVRKGGLLARRQQGDGEHRAGERHAEHGGQQSVGIVDVGDVLVGRAMKGRRRDDQDRRVDEESEQQRAGRVNRGERDRLTLARFGLLEGACLDDARVQIEVVRHDGRAEDANGNVERRWVEDDLAGWDQAGEHGREGRMRDQGFVSEAAEDNKDQRGDDDLEIAEVVMLKQQNEEDIGGGQNRADDEGDVEQQVERQRGADHFGQIGRGDCNLAQ
jgi:hypothetical protein